MDLADWVPPRCIHGHIVLGCPDDKCPTQLAYLDQQQEALDDYYRQQREALRRLFAGPGS